MESSSYTITQILKCEESKRGKLMGLHRFGPYYYSDEAESFSRMKKEGWLHVIKITGRSSQEVRETYMTALGGEIEVASKNTYAAAPEIAILEGRQFRRLMIIHGCSFLLMTLSVLGANADQLKYSGDNFILGSNLGENELERSIRKFYKSICFPGNQIPLVVLNKLMEQTFFKDVVAAKRKWEKPDNDFLLSVLYDLVLAPALATLDNQQIPWMNWLYSIYRFCCDKLSKPRASLVEQPVDILHGLYLQLVGPREGGEDDTAEWLLEEFEDLESGTESGVDENQATQMIPSAKQLSQAGIRFKGIMGLGIRQIHLRRGMWGAVLCLPALSVNTLLMLIHLQDYESIQGFRKREVSAYLRFLSDIACSVGDASFLASQGVFPTDPLLLDRVPGLLQTLAHRDVLSTSNFRSITSTSLQLVRVHITQYSRRPSLFKYFGAIGILTLIGVVFSVLQYFKKG